MSDCLLEILLPCFSLEVPSRCHIVTTKKIESKKVNLQPSQTPSTTPSALVAEVRVVVVIVFISAPYTSLDPSNLNISSLQFLYLVLWSQYLNVCVILKWINVQHIWQEAFSTVFIHMEHVPKDLWCWRSALTNYESEKSDIQIDITWCTGSVKSVQAVPNMLLTQRMC